VSAWETLAQPVAAHTMNATIVGSALVSVLWLALRILAKQSSRSRFTVWFFGLLSVAALPFLFAQRTPTVSAEFLEIPAAWAQYFVTLWAFGASLGLLRIGAGLFRLRQLRANAVQIAPTSLPASTAARLKNEGSPRRVTLCHSGEVSVPMVIGFFRPLILLPSGLLPQLSNDELDVIVLHEMAHIRRWDDWTNLAQKFVKAVFFFHPAVWWVDSRLTLEREMACDEMVVEQSPGARAYAGFLISFHEKLQNAGAPALVQALVSRMSQLAARVTQILDTRQVCKSRIPLVATSLAMLAVLGAAPKLPELVSFGSAPGVASSTTRAKQHFTTRSYEEAGLTSAAPQAKVVDAAYHPSAATFAPTAKAKPERKPKVVSTTTVVKQAPVRHPMLVVYQSAQFDGTNWTICVWSVDPTTNTTVQSIVMRI